MSDTDQLPVSFFDQRDSIKKRVEGKNIFLFLDYDGTLTPIVATPDLAVISEDMRDVVKKACDTMKVSIVSGRATDDVRDKVQLDGIYYAGSHGFEIVDPDGKVAINDEAAKIRGTIDEVCGKLSQRLKGIKGALVENVKYTISSHYRQVADEDFPYFEQEVDKVLEEYPVLRKTSGKKVFELRPRIDWDKGKAVNWILKHLKFEQEKNIPIYIGDDTTDEDAFRALEKKGFGVLVAEDPRASEAEYVINDTDDVKKVIEFFIELSKG